MFSLVKNELIKIFSKKVNWAYIIIIIEFDSFYKRIFKNFSGFCEFVRAYDDCRYYFGI